MDSVELGKIMTFGAQYWAPPLIAGISGMFGGGQPKETKMQRTQRKLIDELLGSLGGGGRFSDLYNPSEEAFQKSFVEPAQQRFQSQIAPQIQQQYIASGQQRGTGMEDTLTRAGVDLNSMLNQQYYQFQQDALNRQQNTIGSILGQGAGAPPQQSALQNFGQGVGGYLGSPGFAEQFRGLFSGQGSPQQQYGVLNRKGYE
jgi:hypothetical protein